MSDTSPQGKPYIAPLLRTADSNVVQLERLSHHHLALMDYMLANPTVPQWAVANAFGRTQAWISTVVNSDLFQAHFAERRKLIEDDQQRQINSKLFNMASKGLDKLSAGLDDDEVSVAEKRAITRLALEASGNLADRKGPTVVVNNAAQVNNSEVNASAVQAARERILKSSKLGQSLLGKPADIEAVPE